MTINGLISIEEYQEILPLICDNQTAYNPELWTPENPLAGQCTMAVLGAHELFDFDMLKGSLKGTEFEALRLHYVNRMKDGNTIDFTKDQFGENYPQITEFKKVKPEKILKWLNVRKRYEIFAERLQNAINQLMA